MAELRIGVVGYSAKRFDRERAQQLLIEAYDGIEKDFPSHEKTLVSGLTDIGVPSLSYREAQRRRWRTVGVACAKASEYPCFPVDERIIIGSEWGEESQTFLDYIDVLIRIGGGAQATREISEAKARGKKVIEYDLPILE